MDRSDERVMQYASFLSGQARENKLLHFSRGRRSTVAEYGARLADHQGKLSTRFGDIADIAAEASHRADSESRTVVSAEDIDTTIAQRAFRSGMIQDRLRRLIVEGTLLIQTDGEKIGELNGLSVLSLGDSAFGQPTRVTAQTAVGAEGIVDVQRESNLSGRIYNKAFQIVTGFLMSRFAQDKPLTLTARVTFEQTYDEIEGDSALTPVVCPDVVFGSSAHTARNRGDRQRQPARRSAGHWGRKP